VGIESDRERWLLVPSTGTSSFTHSEKQMGTPHRASESQSSIARITFTPNEVARATGLHPDTIRAKCQSKDINATKLGGRYLIPAAEVQRLFGTVPQVAA
jgi:excisionase family DNA binding protein